MLLRIHTNVGENLELKEDKSFPDSKRRVHCFSPD